MASLVPTLRVERPHCRSAASQPSTARVDSRPAAAHERPLLFFVVFALPGGRPRLGVAVAAVVCVGFVVGFADIFGSRCFNSSTQSFAARAPSTIPPTSALFVGIDLAMNATGNTVPYENEYDIV